MSRISIVALLFTLVCSIPARAQAPNTYRCGNSYSQSPCPGGVMVDTADSRSNAQKTQSDAVIRRDKTTAEGMEKSRLQQEEALRRNQDRTPQEQAIKNQSMEKKTAQPLRPARKNKLKNPDNFTAKAPSEKKSKKQTSSAEPQ
jgi:hypothetical protein